MKSVREFFRREGGATAVEYAVMMALIAAVVIGSVLAMSYAAADSFQDSAEKLDAVL